MTFRCIKLDSAWRPVEVITWFEAFCQVNLEPFPCTVLWEYPEKYKIRSQSCNWSYPAIIGLKNYVKPKKEKPNVKPSLKAILIRDMFKCQYCMSPLNSKSGTRDHVIPESKGGPDTWTNLVACCKSCQNKKKDYLPEDVGMYPIKPAKAPLLEERFAKFIKISSSFERNVWVDGFKSLGLEHLVHVNDEN